MTQPLLVQSVLTRSAIVLVQYDKERGTFGLAVNRQVPRGACCIRRQPRVPRGGDVDMQFLSIPHPHGELPAASAACGRRRVLAVRSPGSSRQRKTRRGPSRRFQICSGARQLGPGAVRRGDSKPHMACSRARRQECCGRRGREGTWRGS